MTTWLKELLVFSGPLRPACLGCPKSHDRKSWSAVSHRGGGFTPTFDNPCDVGLKILAFTISVVENSVPKKLSAMIFD
ncbi:hypothetical protein TNIN_325171 [Trichonephila inaurata madagascariensis]|uniref:Uncharacterized protein n=1 Tax=Trichonephila inaurata madagascariensis TaxID=2747483 RepID=A0A8X7C224_9ARAC|nr:hypothetical protein TNIN_325171 [Trichonephila inaurata madagascariensis]